MKKLLTITVPSYNVETTLRQAVESLLVPDLEQRAMLDILIVNDGSTDGTQKLAEQLAAENPGIVRVWNKENGGHGSTINVGIEQGYGKYMKLLDGDDWLDTVALSDFLRVLADTDADVVATDYVIYDTPTQKLRPVKASKLPYGKILRFSDIYDRYNFSNPEISVKIELLRGQPARIDEHCYYVDIEWLVLAALVCETVLYIDQDLYVYRLAYAGQSVSTEAKIRLYPDHERMSWTLMNWYSTLSNTQPGRKDKRAYLDRIATQTVAAHYRIGIDFPKMEMIKFIGHLREYEGRLKQKGEEFYRLAKKDLSVRWCHLTNFSPLAYGILGRVKRLRNKMKG